MHNLSPHQGGFVTTLKRELQYYKSDGCECLISIFILLASMITVAWIFSSGTLTNLPIAVIDHDGSSVSGTYSRMLEATPEMHIVDKLSSTAEAKKLLEQASIYAFVVIPRDFAKDIKTGQQTTVVAWHSGQFLTMSGVILKSLRQVTGTMSAGVKITALSKKGESTLAANVDFSPLQSELRTLFNPFQNYQYFLVASLLPAMLQVFVMIWTVYIVGREFQNSTFTQWLDAKNNVYAAIAAKVLPIFILASCIGIGCLYWLFGYMRWPINGSVSFLILGWELMILAYIVLGLLFASLASRLATALSFAVFFTAPAFAYVGITFPQHAMPLLAKIWAYILPIKTLLRLQVEQVEIGAPIVNSLPELLTLIAFILLPLPLAINRIHARSSVFKKGR
ncbi:ABC transporter permease [Pseudoalteromonas fuliginea]|uniref:ABC transporter permease n=1 Tax=Pseudoalteromonas fuliginea TaxID=1872678 RepID=A0AB73BG94_9GAMM|nr:ABC transporter permease [Pseudoalteromonas fuliginea]KAA1159796.1 ABC transporter permease [Pseudoalteromonas fuliginea]